MIFARQAADSDEDAIVELGRAATVESFPHLAFDEDRARETIRSSFREPPRVFFVVEQARAVIGFSICSFEPLAFADGFSTHQRVIYVRPDMRGTRAAAELVQAFDRWTHRLQPVEALITVGSGRRSEAVARLMRRFGFDVIGHVLRKLPEPAS